MAFIKKYALGVQSIEVGLFVGMATELDNLEAKYRFFADNIMDPIASGQAYNLEISEVILFNNSELREELQLPKDSNAITFMVKVSLKEDFKANLEKVLENISDSQKQLGRTHPSFHEGYVEGGHQLFGYPYNEKDRHVEIAYFPKDNTRAKAYLLKDLRSFQRSKDKGRDRDKNRAGYICPKTYSWLRAARSRVDDTLAELEINFVSENGNAISGNYYISRMGVSVKNSENIRIGKRSRTAMKNIGLSGGHLVGHLKYQSYFTTIVPLFEEITYHVVMKVPVDVLREIGGKGKMEVRYSEESLCYAG